MIEEQDDTPASAAMEIDVVSDVVCPWCYVGKRKLEQALREKPGAAVEVRWRPFQLDPTIPPDGLDRDTYMQAKFGDTARLAQVHERLVETGRELGIAFAFDKIKRAPNTLDAHRLIRWAQPAGKQNEVGEALFRRYFVEGEDIGDPAVLVRVADENGLDADRIGRWLAEDVDREAVRQEIASAVRLGVSGVPFFIFASKFAVSGAQSPEVLGSAIEKAMHAAPAVLPA